MEEEGPLRLLRTRPGPPDDVPQLARPASGTLEHVPPAALA
jgi:hypothetical protein